MHSCSAVPGSSPPPAPRWVKVFGGILIAAILLLALLMVIRGGSHGPGRHFGADTASEAHTVGR